MKKPMCSIVACTNPATHEHRYKSGAIGEYCDKHYLRLMGKDVPPTGKKVKMSEADKKALSEMNRRLQKKFFRGT